MGPESSPVFSIPPAPEGPIVPKPEVPVAEQIVMPDFVSERAVEAQPISTDQAAEAAQRIISSVPGYENTQPQPQTPSREVIDIPMPADPSHVIGWEGQVRR